MRRRVPVDELGPHGVRRGVDEVERLRGDAALKLDQASAGLQDLPAGEVVQVDVAEGGEGEVARDVGACGQREGGKNNQGGEEMAFHVWENKGRIRPPGGGASPL